MNSGKSTRRKVLLTVAAVTVHTFSSKPTVEVIAIADQKTTGVGGTLGRALTGRILRKEAGPLDADLGTGLLGCRARAERDSDTCNHYCYFSHFLNFS